MVYANSIIKLHIPSNAPQNLSITNIMIIFIKSTNFHQVIANLIHSPRSFRFISIILIAESLFSPFQERVNWRYHIFYVWPPKLQKNTFLLFFEKKKLIAKINVSFKILKISFEQNLKLTVEASWSEISHRASLASKVLLSGMLWLKGRYGAGAA